MYAADQGNDDVIKLLIDNGADRAVKAKVRVDSERKSSP
jgi:ankyrin repeat protein